MDRYRLFVVVVGALFAAVVSLGVAGVDGAQAIGCMDSGPAAEQVAACSPTPLHCAPGTVPGWLDGAGNPTSCVDDHPMVDPEPTATAQPAPIQPAPVQPASTPQVPRQVAPVHPVAPVVAPVAAQVVVAPVTYWSRTGDCPMILLVCPVWQVP